MKNTMKRLLAFACVIALVVGMMVTATAAGKPTITVEKKELSQATGTQDVTVTLGISGNTGLAGLQLRLSYAEGLTLKKVDNSSAAALKSLTLTVPGNLAANPVILPWDGLDADTTNGVIVTLTFEVSKETAKSYAIEAELVEAYDGDMADVEVDIVNGGITVKCSGNHVYDEGVVTTAPTCGKEGVKTFTCTGCGATKTEPVAPTGEHTPDGNTDCAKDTKCTVCEQVIKAAGEHDWDEGAVTTEPTCTEKGEATFTCENCGATKTGEVDELGHELAYGVYETGDEHVVEVNEDCGRCDHKATATLTATDAVYTGKAIETAAVEYSEGWEGGELEIAYANNLKAGEATASVTIDGVTATATFAIAKAETHTITLGNLTQYAGSVTGVTYTIDPADETAEVYVGYQITVPESPCLYQAGGETGTYVTGEEEVTHVHDEECGYAAEYKYWTTEVPTAVGSYPVCVYLTGSENIVVVEGEPEKFEGILTISNRIYGGGSTTAPKEEDKEEDKEEEKPAGKSYGDVAANAWYAESVNFVTEKGLMNGVGEGTFAPEATVTRNMVMTVLARLAGIDTEGGANWYEKAMNWAKAQGITDGSNAEGVITREQLVTMLYRYMGSPAVTVDLSKYTDAASVSDWATNAMAWAVENGIVTGMTETTLGAEGDTTRAQLATILMRFVSMAEK